MALDLSGMDVQQVNALAEQLENRANSINGVINTIDGVVAGLLDVWSGDDMEAFSAAWRQAHKPAAAAAASELVGYVGQLQKEMAQQVDASGGELGGGGSGFVAPLAALEAGGVTSDNPILKALERGGLSGAALATVLASLLTSPALGAIDFDLSNLGAGIDVGATFVKDGLSLDDLEDLPEGAQKDIAELLEVDDSGAFHDLSTGLNVFGSAASAFQMYEDTEGETTSIRVLTSGETGAADFAINKYPITAGANYLSFGSLQTDANWGVQVMNGFVDGFATGGVSGGIHEADVQWNQWADGVASGQDGAPLQWLANGENTVISKAYGPVSDAIGSAASTVTHATSSVEHLASKVFGDL